MPVLRWKLAALPLAAAALAPPLLASCQRTDNPDAASPGDVTGGRLAGPAPVCDEVKTGDFSTLIFGGPSQKRGPFDPPPPPPLPPGTGDNVKFLLGQTYRLAKIPPVVEQELIDACVELGRAAGLGEDELKAAPDNGHGAEKACNTAATKASAMFRKARETKVILDLAIEPTRCFVDVDAARKCLTDCGAPPHGDIRAQCVGGEIAGACSGRCTGICSSVPAGPGAGVCRGACSGKCDREFRGTCGGKCSGTCDGQPTRGPRRCPGVCDGSCSGAAEKGVCLGRCDGACSGAWEPAATGGRCPGVCVGGCLGDMQAPLCTGEFSPVGTEPVCQAACGASAALGARCDLPRVRVAVRSGNGGPELERLLVGIQSAVPKIVRLQQGPAKRLPRAIETAVTASADWSNAFATAGRRPLFCIRKNSDALKEAATWIDLAVRGADAIGPAIKTEVLLQAKPEDE